MSYVGYGQSPYVQEPKVRFDAIGEAWQMTRDKMGVWVVAMLVYFAAMLVVLAIVGAILYAAGMITAPSQGNPDFLSPVARIIINIVSLVAGAFFQAGLYRMALKQVRGQDIQASDAFSAGDVVGGAIFTQIVYGIAVNIGTLLCVIPGLIVAGRGMFAMPLTVDKNITGIAALQKSWEALKNDTLNAVLFVIVAGLAASLGALACGVGVVFTAPIAVLAVAITYRDFFDTELGMRGPTLDMPLPPQSAYGAGAPGMGGVGQYDVPGTPAQAPPPPPPAAPGQMGTLDS